MKKAPKEKATEDQLDYEDGELKVKRNVGRFGGEGKGFILRIYGHRESDDTVRENG